MATEIQYPSHLADFDTPCAPAQEGERLPVETVLPLIFAINLLLWSLIGMGAQALL